MEVKAIVEIIAEIDVYPDDVVNSDTIGDYKAELDCAVGNGMLDHLSHKLNANIKIESAEPYDTGVEVYGNLLNKWSPEYKKRMKKYEST
jgi:hypothetical protein